MAGADRFATTGRACDAQVVRRLFRPFSKSAHDAAQSAPGVGLGLAFAAGSPGRWAATCGSQRMVRRGRRSR